MMAEDAFPTVPIPFQSVNDREFTDNESETRFNICLIENLN